MAELGSGTVCRRAGISFRQLDYLCRTVLQEKMIGTGKKRRWTYREAAAIWAIFQFFPDRSYGTPAMCKAIYSAIVDNPCTIVVWREDDTITLLDSADDCRVPKASIERILVLPDWSTRV